MECKKDKNMDICNCSYGACTRKGVCCDCLRYHLGSGQVPACFFPDDVESGYDRSIGNFVDVWQQRRHL